MQRLRGIGCKGVHVHHDIPPIRDPGRRATGNGPGFLTRTLGILNHLPKSSSNFKVKYRILESCIGKELSLRIHLQKPCQLQVPQRNSSLTPISITALLSGFPQSKIIELTLTTNLNMKICTPFHTHRNLFGLLVSPNDLWLLDPFGRDLNPPLDQELQWCKDHDRQPRKPKFGK